MEEKQISLDSFLNDMNIKLSDSAFGHDIVVIPRSMLNNDDVTMIKRLRNNSKKVYIHNYDDRKYVEMRGGEFELALMLIDKLAIPIIVSLTTMWISKRVESWKSAKNETSPDSIVDPPDFKMEFYIKDKQKYVKIDGDAETALRELKKLQEDD